VPQVLENVAVRERMPFASLPEVSGAIRDAERLLNGNGRLLVRYSGTEMLARVMVEGERADQIDAIARSIAGAIRARIGT